MSWTVTRTGLKTYVFSDGMRSVFVNYLMEHGIHLTHYLQRSEDQLTDTEIVVLCKLSVIIYDDCAITVIERGMDTDQETKEISFEKGSFV